MGVPPNDSGMSEKRFLMEPKTALAAYLCGHIGHPLTLSQLPSEFLHDPEGVSRILREFAELKAVRLDADNATSFMALPHMVKVWLELERTRSWKRD